MGIEVGIIDVRVPAMEHEDIAKYVQCMKSKSNWFGAPSKDASYTQKIRRLYNKTRFFLFSGVLVFVCVGLYSAESYGLYDGTFAYMPCTIYMMSLSYIASSSGRQQDILVNSFNRHFISHSEPWMRDIKNKYLAPTYKAIKILIWYDFSILFLYMAAPRTLDAILHYGFNSLESPLQLPEFLTPLISNSLWTTKYYTVSAINFWALFEFFQVVEGFVINYVLLVVFFLVELLIFKEQVQSLHFMDYEVKSEVDENFKNIVSWHNNIIKLNRDLKAFLGLPCAFQTLFTSLTLTLTLFTTFTSTNIPVVMAYGSGFMFYFSAGLLYCSLGQLLENESEEVFRALYNLPWYRYSPAVRKNFIMMMRQARTPLIIDYHGRSKMNLANFMQILRQSYSYFTLLQSVTGK